MNRAKSLLLILSLLTAVCCASAKPEAASAPPTRDGVQSASSNDSANAQSIDGASPTQEIAPDALVRDLYKEHDADRSPFFQSKNRALVDKYFAKSTADLIWKDYANGSGVLNADPLYNSHDPQTKNFAVNRPKIENDTATVVATFVNYGVKEAVTYQLVKEGGVWKIADIAYKDGRSLLKTFKDDFYSVDAQEQESAPPAAATFTSVYTDMGRDCKHARDAEAAAQGSDPPKVCRGFGDFQISVGYSAWAAAVAVERVNGPDEHVLLGEDYGGYGARGEKVEWRLADGKPFAVIIRFGKYGEPGADGNPFAKRTGSRLVVKGLKGWEQIDFEVDGSAVNANEKARRMADERYSKQR